MAKTVRSICEDNICVSCGICKAVCPCDAIYYERENGLYIPQIDNNKCTECGLCYRVCAARGMKLKCRADGDTPEKELYFGNAVTCLIAQTRDAEVLKNATSGGVVTTLIQTLLSNNTYDAAFCVNTFNYDKAAETVKISAVDELQETPKSRYIPVMQTEAVRYILDNKNKKVILVGVSCFIHGIIKVIEQYKLDRSNYLLIGLFCDKNLNYNIFDYFKAHPSCEKTLKNLYFRTKEAGGYPGNVRLEYTDGTYTDISSGERMKVKDFYQLERCLYCVDKLNQNADLSVGDNYTDEHNSDMGSSCVIVRSLTGKEIWEECAEKFKYWTVDKEKIYSSQGIRERKKNYCFFRLKASENIINPFDGYAGDNIEAYREEYIKRKKWINTGRSKRPDTVRRELKKRESGVRKLLLKIKYDLYETKEKFKVKIKGDL